MINKQTKCVMPQLLWPPPFPINLVGGVCYRPWACCVLRRDAGVPAQAVCVMRPLVPSAVWVLPAAL